MKKISVSFNEITDTSGYLFSLAKCFAALLKSSEYAPYAEDIIAASGFAFRMWVDQEQLCPSATSIWEFKKQPEWFGNTGLCCGYVERLWGEDSCEEERRLAAIENIRQSVDRGTGAVAWDISGCEWGVITGYDEENRMLSTLKTNGSEDSIPYEKLGRLELPILSLLTVIGKREKSPEDILADTKKLALAHLKGQEWSSNVQGIAAYDALIDFISEKLSPDTAWNLEYYLGTYAALKWYAWKFFEKYGEFYLAYLYKTAHESWQEAFLIQKSSSNPSQENTCRENTEHIVQLLSAARKAEQEAVKYMSL